MYSEHCLATVLQYYGIYSNSSCTNLLSLSSKMCILNIAWLQYSSIMVFIQSKLFITSLVITEYSISDIKLLGTDLFSL